MEHGTPNEVLYVNRNGARNAKYRSLAAWTFLLAVAAVPAVANSASDDPNATFEKEVRPILAQRCFECHGPDKQESGLRLDSAAAMHTGGSRGQVVDPGNADSLLLQAIRRTGELKMPPETELAASEIARLEQWIVAGAAWPEYDTPATPANGAFAEARTQHWAYQPLPEILQDPNPIDASISRALNEAGLEPSPPADKRTLIRRVTYDLTGLPPTIEDVEAFVADTRPEAFANLVDRLLATPQYGERWARHWLDVVRYTDSFDSRASAQTDPVEIWRYRDWVVNAINADMPYDDFAAYQVAGDLLPLPNGEFNRDGLIATGMLAIGNWPQGDADKQKMVADIVDDQVDVVMRTFLGVTMACARCHDHKFEPYSTEEYYGLAGIFFSSSILPGPGQKTEGSPILHLPLASAETLAQRTAMEQRLAALSDERTQSLTDARNAFINQQIQHTDDYLLAASEDTPTNHPELNEHVLRNWARILEGDILPALQTAQTNFQQIPGLTTRSDADSTPSAVANATDAEVRYSTITHPAQSIVVHPGPQESVGIGWRAPAAMNVTLSGLLSDADGNCGNGIRWTVVHRKAGIERTLAEGRYDNGGASDVIVNEPVAVEPGDQVRLIVYPDNDYSCDTTRIAITIASDNGQSWSLNNEVLPRFADGNPWSDASGNPDVWWFLRGAAESTLDPGLFAPWQTAAREVKEGRRDNAAMRDAAASIQAGINEALANAESPLRPAVDQLTSAYGPYWLDVPPTADTTRIAEIDAEIGELQTKLNRPIDYAVGIQEGGVPNTEHAGIHDVHIHHRGEYSNLGDLVPRAMPAIVADTEARPVTDGSGRRELADWLTGDCAPLLARVMVNRVWQHHFGYGLVRTPGDFGTRGEAPTHPQLLDQLAAQFVASNWSLKELHRAILNTDAYQRSSTATNAQIEADPENRLLARMNRRRLDAESLRDSLIFVSGRLDTAAGGPAYIDLATPRRTLYLRTVRSNLSTYAALFDGADPTAVTPVRNESTVAQQALFLMNHPLLLSTAKALSESVSNEDTAEWVTTLYGRLFARTPTETERAFAEQTLQQLGHPENPEARTAYTQILLSSNEFYFID